MSNKRSMTASEMGKRGAASRLRKLTKERIREIALMGGAAMKAKVEARKAKEAQ
jgi:hypothetical protein